MNMFKLHELRSAHTEGLVPRTKSLRVNYPFSLENLVAGTKIWSLRIVPRIQTMFEFVGQVAGTCPLELCWSLRVNCSWDRSLRPNEKLTNHKQENNVLRRLRD